jgi:hypothetical protein
MSAYWSSLWPGEDGGPARPQVVAGPGPGDRITVVHREAVATTMLVTREPGELYALRHTLGAGASAWVEQVDPITLDVRGRSAELDGGPMWPGGMAAHANGSLHVVFGAHAHRLDPSLRVLASVALPRNRPYNSFVVMPDGTLVTKDFGGVLARADPAMHQYEPCELLALHPDSLAIVDRCVLPEASIARISADDANIYVVGLTALHRIRWEGAHFVRDREFRAPYISVDGQTYGWDPVVALGAAWFLDNGFGSERYAGTFRGQGVNRAPLHLVRVDLTTAAVTLTEICGKPNGVVANPPLVDVDRRIVVGFDSGNGEIAAFDIAADGTLARRWRREQNHAAHMLLFAESGELVTTDHDATRMVDEIVVVDITNGEERARVASGSAVQSVLFPAPGWERDFYYCSFAAMARVSPAL